jgi:Uma2 family endonuclease
MQPLFLPRRRGGRISGTDLLLPFVDAHDLGWVLTAPVDVLFPEGDYLEPDIVVLLRGREETVTDRGIEGPPDLIVEVVSGSTAARQCGLKRERYAHFGVPCRAEHDSRWCQDGGRTTSKADRGGHFVASETTAEADRGLDRRS